MKKLLIGAVLILGGIFVFLYTEKQVATFDTHKNIEYLIEGEKMMLDGAAQYLGNEFITDVNEDGLNDVVFLITHQPGGSGTFFYVVVARNTGNGYIGSDGYFLGDRIIPQSIELSNNPRHANVVVVTYLDRLPNEPMVTQPSIEKSVYLKLDTESMQWGVVEPNFEGESR